MQSEPNLAGLNNRRRAMRPCILQSRWAPAAGRNLMMLGERLFSLDSDELFRAK